MHRRWSNGNAADAHFMVGGSNPGVLTYAAAALLQIIAAPGFEPPAYKFAVACITTRPPPILEVSMVPTAHKVSATNKKPKVCVSV